MDPVQGKITDLLEPEAEKRILAMRQPGIEPGSTAWKAAMLTTIPPTHVLHAFKWAKPSKIAMSCMLSPYLTGKCEKGTQVWHFTPPVHVS